jgi:transcriptional regulator with XRE-family HTH domain
MPRPKTQAPDKTREEQTAEAKDLVIRRLRTAMRLLGFTNREIERRLGYTPSYLTRLLSGEIELRFEHIVEIASAMGMTAEEFFQFAYPDRPGERSEPAIQLAEILEELRPAKNPVWTSELESKLVTLLQQNIDLAHSRLEDLE